jgi:hypothetical protein
MGRRVLGILYGTTAPQLPDVEGNDDPLGDLLYRYETVGVNRLHLTGTRTVTSTFPS